MTKQEYLKEKKYIYNKEVNAYKKTFVLATKIISSI